MERTTEQWQNCSPEVMAGMSKAAIAFAFADAKKDQLSLRAEIERLRTAKIAWLPAATAPEDGTHFLAYFPRHPFDEDENMNEAVDLGGIMAVTFKNGNGWVEPDYMDAIGAYFGDDYCYAPAPTHWMALPPPPVTPNAGANPPTRHGVDHDD